MLAYIEKILTRQKAQMQIIKKNKKITLIMSQFNFYNLSLPCMEFECFEFEIKQDCS